MLLCLPYLAVRIFEKREVNYFSDHWLTNYFDIYSFRKCFTGKKFFLFQQSLDELTLSEVAIVKWWRRVCWSCFFLFCEHLSHFFLSGGNTLLLSCETCQHENNFKPFTTSQYSEQWLLFLTIMFQSVNPIPETSS